MPDPVFCEDCERIVNSGSYAPTCHKAPLARQSFVFRKLEGIDATLAGRPMFDGDEEPGESGLGYCHLKNTDGKCVDFKEKKPE